MNYIKQQSFVIREIFKFHYLIHLEMVGGPTPPGQPIANVTISNNCQGTILDLDADFAFTQYDTVVNLLACPPPPPPIYGCMDSTALNYDSTATVDDGSCSYPTPIYGCMDPNSANFNPWATAPDYSCQARTYELSNWGISITNSIYTRPMATRN